MTKKKIDNNTPAADIARTLSSARGAIKTLIKISEMDIDADDLWRKNMVSHNTAILENFIDSVEGAVKQLRKFIRSFHA